MAIAKEKSWFVYDRAALDRAWQELTIEELIAKVDADELLDPQLAEEARKLSKGVQEVRWLGQAYLGTFKGVKESLQTRQGLDHDLVRGLRQLAKAAGPDRTLWEFYASRWFYDRWFTKLPGEVDVDWALLHHVTYTGVRFREQDFQGILFGPCKDKNLLRRNLLAGNIMEVPPIEEIAHDPGFVDALVGITETYLRERITRAEYAKGAWGLIQALQRSIQFARERGLPMYVTLETELVVAPDFSFSERESRHRKAPPPRAARPAS